LARQCRIDARAQLYIAMWINMTAARAKLLTWLKGGDPHLRAPVPAGRSIGWRAFDRGVQQATDYYTKQSR